MILSLRKDVKSPFEHRITANTPGFPHSQPCIPPTSPAHPASKFSPYPPPIPMNSPQTWTMTARSAAAPSAFISKRTMAKPSQRHTAWVTTVPSVESPTAALAEHQPEHRSINRPPPPRRGQRAASRRTLPVIPHQSTETCPYQNGNENTHASDFLNCICRRRIRRIPRLRRLTCLRY